jgi:uncharacterized protein (TIGR00730 family)
MRRSRGYMVITGAGPGIMEAAQGGAGAERSFGVNIRLPFEQSANTHIHRDAKLITFRYFFTRKLMFMKEADAVVVFPGGFGTLDEGFEALTLVQTGKEEPLPIIFVAPPGDDFWERWRDTVLNRLLQRGLISDEDIHLFKVTHSLQESWDEIERFYSNYHSSRYVGERLMLRVRRAPDATELAGLNTEFANILASGAIEVTAADPQENNEPKLKDFKRVALKFDRRSFGRLRKLIDRLNAMP